LVKIRGFYKWRKKYPGHGIAALYLSWNDYKWNSITRAYELAPMVPDSGMTKYYIPVEDDGLYHPELWYPPFLFMQWPSGLVGHYGIANQRGEDAGPKSHVEFHPLTIQKYTPLGNVAVKVVVLAGSCLTTWPVKPSAMYRP
jgi:hypothetical protein